MAPEVLARIDRIQEARKQTTVSAQDETEKEKEKKEKEKKEKEKVLCSFRCPSSLAKSVTQDKTRQTRHTTRGKTRDER
jgi:hypothetical protein